MSPSTAAASPAPPPRDSLRSNSGALWIPQRRTREVIHRLLPASPLTHSPCLRRAGVLLSALPALFSALRAAVHHTSARFLASPLSPPLSPPLSHPDACVFSVTEGSGTRCSGSKRSSEIFFFLFKFYDAWPHSFFTLQSQCCLFWLYIVGILDGKINNYMRLIGNIYIYKSTFSFVMQRHVTQNIIMQCVFVCMFCLKKNKLRCTL